MWTQFLLTSRQIIELQSNTESSKNAGTGKQMLRLSFYSLNIFTNFPTSPHPFKDCIVPIQQEDIVESCHADPLHLGVWLWLF